MNTKLNVARSKRPLFINFSFYTDNDADFMQELVEHMIDNLRELQQSYRSSLDQKELTSFLKSCHKVKTTLAMLADNELSNLVEDLQNKATDELAMSSLNKLCSDIIDSLLSAKG